MWQKFSDPLKAVIHSAVGEARKRQSDQIHPEDLLRSLIMAPKHEEHLVLERLGAAPLEIELGLVSYFNSPATTPNQEIALAPKAKRTLDYANLEAKMRRSDHVGTEHLLLGLVRQQETFAHELLSTHGLTLENTRTVVAKLPRRKKRDCERLG